MNLASMIMTPAPALDGRARQRYAHPVARHWATGFSLPQSERHGAHPTKRLFLCPRSMAGASGALRSAAPRSGKANLVAPATLSISLDGGDSQLSEDYAMSALSVLPTHAVEIVGARAQTTSLIVAEVFGKQHQHVLRDIDRLDCSPEFRASNFGRTSREVPGPRNSIRQERYFTLTKDGFVFLAMGYTGAQAAAFKEAYIRRFNEMDAALHAPAVTALISPAQAGELATRLAERFPDGKQRPYAWSRFNSHFRIARYRELPASRVDEALAYIDQLPPPEPAKLSAPEAPVTALPDPASGPIPLPATARPIQRWLACYGPHGWALHEIPLSAFVLPAEDWPAVIATSDFPRHLLPAVQQALAQRLSRLMPSLSNPHPTAIAPDHTGS